MTIEEIRDYYLGLGPVEECFPFDDTTLVMKIGGKMFGYIPLEREEPYLVLKCDPDRSEDLRQRYDAIEPAYHMNKRHWIGLHLAQGLERSLITSLIQHAYTLVWDKLPKRVRETLN